MPFSPYTPLSQTDMLANRPLDSSPSSAPVFTQHRLVKVTPDAGTITKASRGMNMAGFKVAHIRAIPSSGITPTITILFWSQSAGRFVQEHTTISKAAPGAGVAFDFTVDVQGRIIFAFVTGTIGAGKQVEVLVAGGADLDRAS